MRWPSGFLQKLYPHLPFIDGVFVYSSNAILKGINRSTDCRSWEVVFDLWLIEVMTDAKKVLIIQIQSFDTPPTPWLYDCILVAWQPSPHLWLFADSHGHLTAIMMFFVGNQYLPLVPRKKTSLQAICMFNDCVFLHQIL